jgi:organic radical activating enzyme
MKANIMEIFRSVQGEGKYAGVQQVFVRFFECNMHCAWCDTPHSIGDTTRRYHEYSLDDLWKEISGLWDGCHSVSLTGGEPLLQAGFIKELLVRFKKANILSYLETNGVCPQALAELIEDLDIIAMDIKLPSSTKCRAYWAEHKEFLTIARQKDVFVKTVITSDTDKEEVLRSADLVAEVDPEILFILQPNYFDRHNGVIKKCVEFQRECSARLKDVRVLPQIHKAMQLQ